MMCIHFQFQAKKYFRKKTAEITRFDGTLTAGGEEPTEILILGN